ncbi:hypothetical protein TNCV_2631061 [Trichonephila clavipes]|nr:hypothetical protein TNCV_2631061 [Trichonephila clavipes]
MFHRRKIIHLGKTALKTPMETLEVWAVAPSCCQDPFLGEREIRPLLYQDHYGGGDVMDEADRHLLLVIEGNVCPHAAELNKDYSEKEKENVGSNPTITPRNDKILIGNSKTNQNKVSPNLRRNLLDYGVEVSTSTLQKMVLEVSRQGVSEIRIQILVPHPKMRLVPTFCTPVPASLVLEGTGSTIVRQSYCGF